MDCNFPREIKNPKTNQWMKVPCGKCMACRIARVRDWSVRLLDEQSVWDETSFITLTYDDEHLPHGNCGKPTLVKKDLQNFFKRLRKALHEYKYENDIDYCSAYEAHLVHPDSCPSPPLLKYFACGEMGPVTGRPHYHAIVFGLDSLQIDVLEKCWKLGFVSCEPSNIERIKYVCGYVEKKMFYDPKDNFNYGYGCQVAPFQLMSQGLGLKHFTDHIDDYVFARRKTIKGVSYSFPRYYLKKNEDFKTLMSFKGYANQLRALENESSALEEGRDVLASRVQREMDLRARSKLKKGKI